MTNQERINLRKAIFEGKELMIINSTNRTNGKVSKFEGKKFAYKNDKFIIEGKEHSINHNGRSSKYWINANGKRFYIDFDITCFKVLNMD